MTKKSLFKEILPVKMLLLDVDGVLTSGDVIYNDDEAETKIFSVKDGLGIRLLMDSGIKVGIITGRSSGALLARTRNLGIDLVYDGVKDKEAILEKIVTEHELRYDEIAFAGDDLPDIRVMKKTGCPFTIADACPEVKDVAVYTTEKRGGRGAVREICELILKTKGLWDHAIEKFL